MDKVTFTGFKNVGTAVLNLDDKFIPRFRRTVIELNNEGRPDLDNFKALLNGYPFKNDGNFLQMDTFELAEPTAQNRSNVIALVNSIPLEQKISNISIIKMLAGLLENIGDTPNKDLIVSKEYLKSEKCMKNFTQDTAYKPDAEKGFPVEKIHSPALVKSRALDMHFILSSIVESILSTCN